jgi:hypothetical protein
MLRAWTTVAMCLLTYCSQSIAYGKPFNQTSELVSEIVLDSFLCAPKQIELPNFLPKLRVFTEFFDVHSSCKMINVSGCLFWVNGQTNHLSIERVKKIAAFYPKNILQSCWKRILKTNKVESPGIFLGGLECLQKLIVFFWAQRVVLLFFGVSLLRILSGDSCKIMRVKNSVYQCFGLLKLRFARWFYFVKRPIL